jgi:hypothetical protein
LESDPVVLLVVRDGEGRAVRSLEAERKAGLHRTAWDLRLPAPDPVRLDRPEFEPPWVRPPQGPLAPAGSYTVELVQVRPGSALSPEAQGAAGPTVEVLAGPETFEVVDTPAVAAAGSPGSSPGAGSPGDGSPGGGRSGDGDFALVTAALARRVLGATRQVDEAQDRVRHLRAGLAATPEAGSELSARLDATHRALAGLRRRLVGDPVRQKLSEADEPSIDELVGRVMGFHWDTTGPPTATQRGAVDRAADAFEPLATELADLVAALTSLSVELDAAGGPWTPR